MKKTTIAMSLAAALTAGQAFALGVGTPQVRSYLGEPLEVTAPLILESNQRGQLANGSVRVGDAALFRQFQLQQQAVHSQLEATLERKNGETYVRLTSRRPFTEPMLELPLDIRIGGSRLVRVVTLLVDPASAASRDEAERQPTAATQADTAPADAAAHRTTAPPPPRPRSGAQMPTPAQRTNGSYGPVALNQTLSDIAQEIGYDEATLYQNLVALWEANPEAFLRNNMNHLKAGSTLRIPSREMALSRSPAAAKREVLIQYHGGDKTSTAEQQPSSTAIEPTASAEAPQAEPAAQTEAPERDAPESGAPTEEQTEATEEGGRLKITTPASEGEIPPEFREEFNALYVALDETEKENSELRERINLLEKQVAAMSEMLLADAAERIDELDQAAKQAEGAELALATDEDEASAQESEESLSLPPQLEPEESVETDGAEMRALSEPAEAQAESEAPVQLAGEETTAQQAPTASDNSLRNGVIAAVVIGLVAAAGAWLLRRRRQLHHYQQLFKDF
ncbi:MAG: type IV pilus assembly protein FimV [Pseudomonadota bacterium]